MLQRQFQSYGVHLCVFIFNRKQACDIQALSELHRSRGRFGENLWETGAAVIHPRSTLSSSSGHLISDQLISGPNKKKNLKNLPWTIKLWRSPKIAVKKRNKTDLRSRTKDPLKLTFTLPVIRRSGLKWLPVYSI